MFPLLAVCSFAFKIVLPSVEVKLILPAPPETTMSAPMLCVKVVFALWVIVPISDVIVWLFKIKPAVAITSIVESANNVWVVTSTPPVKDIVPVSAPVFLASNFEPVFINKLAEAFKLIAPPSDKLITLSASIILVPAIWVMFPPFDVIFAFWAIAPDVAVCLTIAPLDVISEFWVKSTDASNVTLPVADVIVELLTMLKLLAVISIVPVPVVTIAELAFCVTPWLPVIVIIPLPASSALAIVIKPAVDITSILPLPPDVIPAFVVIASLPLIVISPFVPVVRLFVVIAPLFALKAMFPLAVIALDVDVISISEFVETTSMFPLLVVCSFAFKVVLPSVEVKLILPAPPEITMSAPTFWTKVVFALWVIVPKSDVIVWLFKIKPAVEVTPIVESANNVWVVTSTPPVIDIVPKFPADVALILEPLAIVTSLEAL